MLTYEEFKKTNTYKFHRKTGMSEDDLRDQYESAKKKAEIYEHD